MKLMAISDLHLSSPVNRAAFEQLPSSPADWLVLAGDVAETLAHLEWAFRIARARFARVIWTPGNHELWVTGREPLLSGPSKYAAIVDLARSLGIVTPEDPYPVWEGPGGPCLVVPLFTLYDYSFRPPTISREEVVAWARSAGMACADEIVLNPAPYPSREAWCEARCAYSLSRLEREAADLPTVLVNHYPLREELISIPRIPRFTPWCGTRATHDWHSRFRAKVALHGHLHTRRTDWRDGTRFEEVSLGYPRQWDQSREIGFYLREILPGPSAF